MDLQQTMSELSALPIVDRLRVVESLWNSMESEAISVSPDQREEIARRVKLHEENPDEVLTWEQVLDRLRDK